MSLPCPRCGGKDRFFLVARPRNGAPSFWLCNQCRYSESADPLAPTHTLNKALTPDERHKVYLAYAATAEWCATYLWTPDGKRAMDYLHARGFCDETIHKARLGYHPDIAMGGVGDMLWHRDRDIYDAARLGGLLGPQARPKSVLRGTITLPYYSNHRCVMLRSRRLTAGDGPKYLSPAGVALYAGGTPTLYLADQLSDTHTTVVLTEGEFKALLPWQHDIAAVAQPGGGYLPDSFIAALDNRTVVVAYDVEQRSDTFVVSPGEQFTLRTVGRLTGITISERIDELTKILTRAKDVKSDADAQAAALINFTAIENQLRELREQLDSLRQRKIRVKVLRLPRSADEVKVDLDGFLLRYGADALRQMIDQAEEGARWYAAHHGAGYRFEHGGMANGQVVANYQARITETIYRSDGLAVTALQRIALLTPSGRRTWCEISDEDWADDRKARQSIRVGLREGTFDDDSRQVLRAIRLLSNQGDPPVERRVFTCTGWEIIAGRWHFLAPDGAIASSGIATTIRAEIDPDATGNHYALCGAGSAAEGASAWRRFLRGEVCPQPLALILAAQAALPVLHRFIGNAARPMTWLYHQTGALKTSLTRAGVMALYGPGFTAERADGAPVPKWDATSVGLGLLVFYYRDMALLIDDYKAGMIHPEQFKRFLHNYSEGTGRTRGTKTQTVDRQRPARCIVFATAEDIPGGDPGMQARLLSMPVEPGSVQTDALSALQRAGAEGHLAAFWREFIQAIALHLDTRNEAAFRTELQALIHQDDEGLPGHRRAAGSLRQNRLAWLYLSRWLAQAGYLSPSEARQLDAAHLDARGLLASSLDVHQRDSRPATIFLSVLGEIIASGELVIERPEMLCPRCKSTLYRTSDGWYCNGIIGDREIPCNYHLAATRIIGFVCEDGIGIAAERAFREVSRVRNDQRQPFAYSSTAIWQQLQADGQLVQINEKTGRPTVTRRNPAWRMPDGKGKASTVLLLRPDAINLFDEGFDMQSDSSHESMRSMRSLTSQATLSHQDAKPATDEHAIPCDPKPFACDPKLTDTSESELGIAWDRTGSHACDPKISAAERTETGQDRMDRMNLSHTTNLRVIPPRQNAGNRVARRRDTISEARQLLATVGRSDELATDVTALTDPQLATLIASLKAREG
jgi:hypothetical protein